MHPTNIPPNNQTTPQLHDSTKNAKSHSCIVAKSFKKAANQQLHNYTNHQLHKYTTPQLNIFFTKIKHHDTF